MPVDVQRDEAEAWFRRRGMPLVVQRATRGRSVIARTAPAVAFLAVYTLMDVGIWLLANIPAPESTGPVEEDVWVDLFVLATLAVGLAFLLAPPILMAWLTRTVLRGRSATTQIVVSGILAALAVGLVPTVTAATGYTDSYLSGVLIGAALVCLLLLVTRLGVGAVLLWAIRKAFQQFSSIGAMASRVLPLLLLVIMFAFFTGELWQAANALSRPQLWLVVGFLAALAIGFLVTSQSDELPALRAASRTWTDLPARLQDTPLAGTTAPAAHSRLTRPERLNVLLVLFLAQAVQVVAFVAVVFAFFVVFGVLMITPGVQETYAAAPLTTATLFGLPVPVSNALFQVSLFLAAFSGLYFTASKTTDERYRKAFFEPLIDEIALSLAARDVYRERWPR